MALLLNTIHKTQKNMLVQISKYLSILLFFTIMIVFTSCDETLFSADTIDGTWLCTETHEDLGERTYYVDINYKPGDSSQVYIYNFLGLSNDITTNLKVTATITNSTLTIPKQYIDSHEVEGSGEISSNKKTITIEYTDLLYSTPWVASAKLTKY